jgi:GntR family transcriptional regulator, transcriptional repressor for pyruvate dehydrogenase complex
MPDAKTSERFPPGATLVARTLRPTRVFEGIVEYFRDQMAQGLLRPGDRLLPERELSERLGVSRHSLREALRAMEMLGVVDVRTGQGAFVRAPDFHAIALFLGIALSLQPSVFDRVTEARIAIECEAIRLACERADTNDLALIKEALCQIPRQLADADRGGDTDFQFHTMIVRAAHSPVILFVYEALEALLKRSHHERRAAVFHLPGFMATMGQAHQRLYEAIVARDADGAEREMRQHFSLAEQYFSRLERQRPAADGAD